MIASWETSQRPQQTVECSHVGISACLAAPRESGVLTRITFWSRLKRRKVERKIHPGPYARRRSFARPRRGDERRPRRASVQTVR